MLAIKKGGGGLVLKVMLSALNCVFTLSSAALPTSAFGTVEGRGSFCRDKRLFNTWQKEGALVLFYFVL